MSTPVDSPERTPGFVLLLVAIATMLMSFIIAPFAASFFAAAVLAGVMYPMQDWLAGKLGDRPAVAATLLTVALTLLVVGPAAGVALFVAKQGTQLFRKGSEIYRERGIDGLIEELPEPLQDVGHWLARHWPGRVRSNGGGSQNGGQNGGGDGQNGGADGTQSGTEGGTQGGAEGAESASSSLLDSADVSSVTDFVAGVLNSLGHLLLDLGILVVTLFFLLQQGKALVDWVVRVVPLEDEEARRLVREFRDVTRAVFGATIITAFLQTAIALIGYWIAGVPYLAIVLLLTFVCAVIPVIGAAMVCGAVGLLMLLDGETGYGIFLIVWGTVPVGLADNFAKPWLAQDKLRLPGSVVLFAMLGGVAVFGPFGIVAGPLIVAFFLASLRLLRRQGLAPKSAEAGNPVSRS